MDMSRFRIQRSTDEDGNTWLDFTDPETGVRLTAKRYDWGGLDTKIYDLRKSVVERLDEMSDVDGPERHQ